MSKLSKIIPMKSDVLSPVSVRLPTSQIKEIDELARENNYSRSEIIGFLISYALKAQKDLEK